MDGPVIVGGALSIFKMLPQAVEKRKVLEDQLGAMMKMRTKLDVSILSARKMKTYWMKIPRTSRFWRRS